MQHLRDHRGSTPPVLPAPVNVPPYRAVPRGAVYHLHADDQVVLVAEHDLSGPLYDLVTAALAIGEEPP
jgi:hypothetical protein